MKACPAMITCANQRSVEEPLGAIGVAAGGDQHVDDLTVLVDGPVHVSPGALDPDVGFVDEPAISW